MKSTRRHFLKSSVHGSLALGIGANLPPCLANASLLSKNNDRVLVVIQLSGGNDGLNTVVPFKDPSYRAARPKLSISESDLLKVDDVHGFHPSLRGIRDLLDQGQLSVLHAVGYEKPNRSHFESMDIWHTCKRKDQRGSDGWLGRFLDQQSTGDRNDVTAMHLGNRKQPFALASKSVRVPTVKRLDEFQLLGTDRDALEQLLQSEPPQNAHEATNELLGFLQSSTRGALLASRRVTAAASEYRSEVQYPTSGLAEKLRLVAQLVDAGLQTRVYYMQLDGFDTHASQPDTHAILLREWSDAVSAFINDLSKHGHDQRVCVMTFSEFGRRVAENASEGTDHGAAGPTFLCGGQLNAGLIGEPASLTDLQEGDLKHNIDFRRIYATVLQDWMSADPRGILGGDFETLPLFKASAR
jgi:uncharacterized protein (DUF1501 family)